MSRRAPSQKTQCSSPESIQLSDGTVVFYSYPKRVEDVPLEYQAAVYAKNQRERDDKREAKERAQLDILKLALRTLKSKLRDTPAGPERVNLEKEIKAKEKSIKKSPKPRRKWSPVLLGSFESGKQ